MVNEEYRCWICKRTKNELLELLPEDFWKPDEVFFKYLPLEGTQVISKGMISKKYRRATIYICKICREIIFRMGPGGRAGYWGNYIDSHPDVPPK